MTNREMKKTAIHATIFALCSIGLMLYRSATKHIMITDAAGTDLYRGDPESAYNLLIEDDLPKGKSNTLVIPLSKSVSSDNIILEDDYRNHRLRIYIDSREEGFYLDNAVMTDLDIITNAVCVNQNDAGSVCLEFTTDELYVNESTLTDVSTLEVNFYKPHEKYEHVVVIDPSAGGSDHGKSVEEEALYEKEITLDAALMIKELSDRDVSGNTKLYFTRLSDQSITPNERIALLKDSGADLFVELSVSESEYGSANGISAFYNDRYFIRSLTNASFADMLLNEQPVEDGLGHMELCSVAAAWGAPWYKVPTAGNGYPILQWQYDRGDYREICGFDPDEDPTGIGLTPTLSKGEGGRIYNLAGQQLQKLQRGINVVGGRKIIVR